MYKRVDRKIRPVPTTFPTEAKVRRHFPENPLDSLPKLTPHPPTFTPGVRLTEERCEALNINATGFLWPEEEKLFLHILRLNEEALAFVDVERGTLKDTYFSPYIIPTVPHVPWQDRNIPIPPGIRDQVIEVLKNKIAAGVYEPCQSSYRSKWFCTVKKNGNLPDTSGIAPHYINADRLH
ncbi:hypothetical protein BV25DRAFT_1873301 [Artomyces pyxidatus]|uniref:Uncharacterized protein n=1 Tax=Artomyces pyxidatus TaxID=48021 RepID=A0ACB8SDW3_9AGAM|nr:hypothetical protein BV25DRAFT_1873301 [Artomyces pyxidatus]